MAFHCLFPHWTPIFWLDGSHFIKYGTILQGLQRRLAVAKHAYLETSFHVYCIAGAVLEINGPLSC